MKQFILKYGLYIILGISLLLQTVTMNSYSFWFDESYSSAITSESAAKAVEFTSSDVHPPLYYIALNAWGNIFGRSDIGLRSMSVFFAMMSLIILYALLRRFFTKPVSLFALLIAGTAPYTIRYAQEARMYTLAATFLLAATLALVVQTQRKANKEKPHYWLWAIYGLLIAGAAYTHYFSSLIVLGHGAYLLSAQPQPKQKTTIKRLQARLHAIDYKGLAVAVLTAAIVYAPWLPTLYQQYGNVSSGFWIPGVTEVSFAGIMSYAFAFYETSGRTVWAYIITILSIIIGIFTYRHIRQLKNNRQNHWQQSGLILLFGSFLLPAAALFIISLIGTSYFYFRYFAQFSLFFYAGLGVMIAFLYRQKTTRSVATTAAVILGAILSIGTVRVLQGVDKTDIDMRTSFTVINQSFKKGDVVVVEDFGQWFDAAHYNQTNQPIKYLTQGYDWGSLDPIRSQQGLIIDDLEDLTDKYKRIWYIRKPTPDTLAPLSWGQGKLQATGDDAIIDLHTLR